MQKPRVSFKKKEKKKKNQAKKAVYVGLIAKCKVDVAKRSL